MRGLGYYAFSCLASLSVLLWTDISREHLALVCIVFTVVGLAMVTFNRMDAYFTRWVS